MRGKFPIVAIRYAQRFPWKGHSAGASVGAIIGGIIGGLIGIALIGENLPQQIHSNLQRVSAI